MECKFAQHAATAFNPVSCLGLGMMQELWCTLSSGRCRHLTQHPEAVECVLVPITNLESSPKPWTRNLKAQDLNGCPKT